MFIDKPVVSFLSALLLKFFAIVSWRTVKVHTRSKVQVRIVTVCPDTLVVRRHIASFTKMLHD
jgi:hypothetical protein